MKLLTSFYIQLSACIQFCSRWLHFSKVVFCSASLHRPASTCAFGHFDRFHSVALFQLQSLFLCGNNCSFWSSDLDWFLKFSGWTFLSPGVCSRHTLFLKGCALFGWFSNVADLSSLILRSSLHIWRLHIFYNNYFSQLLHWFNLITYLFL